MLNSAWYRHAQVPNFLVKNFKRFPIGVFPHHWPVLSDTVPLLHHNWDRNVPEFSESQSLPYLIVLWEFKRPRISKSQIRLSWSNDGVPVSVCLSLFSLLIQVFEWTARATWGWTVNMQPSSTIPLDHHKGFDFIQHPTFLHVLRNAQIRHSCNLASLSKSWILWATDFNECHFLTNTCRNTCQQNLPKTIQITNWHLVLCKSQGCAMLHKVFGAETLRKHVRAVVSAWFILEGKLIRTLSYCASNAGVFRCVETSWVRPYRLSV